MSECWSFVSEKVSLCVMITKLERSLDDLAKTMESLFNSLYEISMLVCRLLSDDDDVDCDRPSDDDDVSMEEFTLSLRLCNEVMLLLRLAGAGILVVVFVVLVVLAGVVIVAAIALALISSGVTQGRTSSSKFISSADTRILQMKANLCLLPGVASLISY